MGDKEEFSLMKSNPKALYDGYIEQMMQGIPLTEDQQIKFEYLKRLLIKE